MSPARSRRKPHNFGPNARRAALIFGCLLASACASKPQGETAVSADAECDQPGRVTKVSKFGTRATDLYFKEQSGRQLTEWKADAALSQFPALLRALRQDGATPLSRLSDQCSEEFECWERRSDLLEFAGARLVSVRVDADAYYGGAHPSGGHSDYLWDRQRQARIRFGDIFTSWPRARAILQPALCADLARQMGANENFDASQMECPKVEEVALTLSGGGGVDDRVWAVNASTSDYHLGSYAAGRAQVTIPLSPELRALVRPEFAADFQGAD